MATSNTSSMFYATLCGTPFGHPTNKVVCVGRNYAAHAHELNNPIPAEPLLFIKPASCLVPLEKTIVIPRGLGSVHHELEVALLLGEPLCKASVEQANAAISGVGLALDLTLRDVQDVLKKQGHPWERAKAFDGACPVSQFVAPTQLPRWPEMGFSLSINGNIQQQGNTNAMLMGMAELVAHMSHVFTLQAGDIILTGTPEGVGPLMAGDQLVCTLESCIDVSTNVEHAC